MAFGRHQFGWSHQGQQSANQLQDNDPMTYITRRRFGNRAMKQGEFTKIVSEEVGIDGFYSIGEILGQGERIVGSADGWNFTDRGPAPNSGGFTVAQLGHYGRGLGSVVISSDIGNYVDFDDKTCRGVAWKVFRTYTGRNLVEYTEFPSFVPHNFSAAYIWFRRGSYWDNGGVRTFYGGFHVPLMIDGQHIQAFITDDGKGNFTLSPVLSWVNQLGWYPDVLDLAPGVMLKMDRYVRPDYYESVVDVGACPGLYFTYTTDAGATWQEVSSAEMWAAEMETVVALDYSDPEENSDLFNDAIEAAHFVSAPLSTRYSVCMALVPEIKTNEVGSTTLNCKVKIGLIDVAAGCSMMETAVLFEGSMDGAQLYMGRGLVGVKGGVLIFTRDVTNGGTESENIGWQDSWKYPARVRFTANGTDIFDWATMPLKESYTGAVSGYDTATLVCPMWDGQHSLYKSLDYGLTWTRAGLIAANGKPPNDHPDPGDEQFLLEDFTVVTFLRKDNVPANMSPLTPWLSDSQYPSPIL